MDTAPYYAALDKIAGDLGATGNSDARILAGQQLLLYSIPQVQEYLEDVCPVEEAKRRKAERIGLVVAFFYTGWILVLVCLYIFFARSHRTGSLTPLIPFMSLPTIVITTFSSRYHANLAKVKGLCVMVSEYAGVKQVPLLIDALHFEETRSAIKQKLSTLLPLYLQGDEPPLEPRLVEELTRQLKTGFASILRQKNAALLEADAAFLVAVLLYFERDLAQGSAVPKAIPPILSRFANTAMDASVPSPDLELLYATTAQCLTYVGARK